MILVLGGTSDSHNYIEKLDEPYVVTVATSYGYREFSSRYGDRVVLVCFSWDSLINFIADNNITKVIDTTHPFALEISKLALETCGRLGIPYINAKRVTNIDDRYLNYPKFHAAATFEDAASDQCLKQGMLFFAIGSKNLHFFVVHMPRSVVRVLDDARSVDICRGLGVPDNRIIAAKGPFSLASNLEIIDKYGVSCLITKESGYSGGFTEKAEAAVIRNIDLFVITH